LTKAAGTKFCGLGLGPPEIWTIGMHHNLGILKGPLLWGVLQAGVLPLAVMGAMLIWLD